MHCTSVISVTLLLIVALGAAIYLVFPIAISPLKTFLYGSANTSLRIPDSMSTSWPKSNANAINSETPTINKTITNKNQNNSIKSPIIIKIDSNSSNKSNISSVISSVRPQASNLMTVINRLRSQAGSRDDNVTDYPDYKLPLCDEMPPDLGPVEVNTDEVELEWVERKYPEVQAGGIYCPQHCTARHRVAIIVPYRDRAQHLPIFLRHMHPFLMKQQIHYGIFIIEQEGDRAFNRAKLMNVGFAESQRLSPGVWQCFVFHDIDLLPTNSANLYSCPRQPRHMSVHIDKYNYQLSYKQSFGGVSALTREQFLQMNGFSNRYWGWGGEDDDMSHRLRLAGYTISRYNESTARYVSLPHVQANDSNWRRHGLRRRTASSYLKDGISNLDYRVVNVYIRHSYTHIVVKIEDNFTPVPIHVLYEYLNRTLKIT